MARSTIRQETSRKASKQKSNRKRRQLVKRWLVAGGAVALAGLFALSSWQAYRNDTIGRMMRGIVSAENVFSEHSGFRLKQIELEGRAKTDKAALLAAIGMAQGESIFAESPADIRDRLEKIATIRHATVTRELPDTLHIALEERTGIALWQHQGKLQVVDADGVVLSRENPDNYKNALIVVGDDAPGKLPELFGLLTSEPSIKPQVVAAVRVGGRRWDLRLKNDVKVMLPEDEPIDALHRLAEWQEQKQVLNRSVATIDFRLKDRVFLHPTISDAKKPQSAPSRDI